VSGVKRISSPPATTRGFLRARPRPSTTGSNRSPTAATACRRSSARTLGSLYPTSTAWRSSTSASAT
jgi:hypothetical protein